MPEYLVTLAAAVLSSSVQIACERRHLGELRHFVDAHLRARRVNARLAGQLLVAIDEACANVIVHGNHEDPDCDLTLTILPPGADEKRLIVEIQDHGIPFDPPAYAPPDLLRYVRERRKGGLGLTLVHLIMDRIEFTTDSAGANLTRLTKTLP